MKKMISTILIITILSSIFLPKISLAYEGTGKTTMEDATIDYDTYKEDSEKGSSSVGTNGEKEYKIEDGTVNSIIKNIVRLTNTIPSVVRVFLLIATDGTTTPEVDKEFGKEFSIQKLVFNKIGIFDVNFFAESSNDTALQVNLKEQISKFYYILRMIAIVGFLVVLIYTGIRMAMASLSAEKAKYKSMIVNWVKGFAILAVLPYIMIIITQASYILIDLCESILTSLCGSEINNIEATIFETSTTSTEKGFSIIIPTLIYWILTFYQLKFFLMYGKRLFSTAFLVIISPLILIQYVFDRAGDNQGESFNVWLKEYALNIMIQPLHAAIYMVFMAMASNILQEAPILAVVFLASLTRSERVMRNILRVKNSATVQSMNDNLSAKKLASKIGK